MEWQIVLDGLVLMMVWFGGLGMVCALAAMATLAHRGELRRRPRAAAEEPAPATPNLVVDALKQFATKRAVGVLALVLVMTSASLGYAQGNGNSGRLPNGRPFQVLQQAIRNVEAALQQQINDLQRQLDNLQARVGADTARVELLMQMVGALNTAVQQLESRMTRAETNLQVLGDYIEAVDARVAFQAQLIAELQRESGSRASALDLLFTLHNQQQGAIAGLQDAIAVINGQLAGIGQLTAQNAARLANLQGQLATLESQYQTTRNQLASGCPPGNSIRQLYLGAPVTCEPTGTAVLTAQQFNFPFTIPPFSTYTGQVFCPSHPAGYVATGGGGNGSQYAEIISSTRVGNGWSATVRNTSTNFESAFATVTVVCARLQ